MVTTSEFLANLRDDISALREIVYLLLGKDLRGLCNIAKTLADGEERKR